MNKRAFALVSAAVALLAASAQAYTINDENEAAYWGAGMPDQENIGGVENYNKKGKSGDVYDPYNEGYAISGMDVSYASGELTVTIYSDAYFDKWRSGKLESGLGSLFLSTNGWNPAGSSDEHYNTDGMNAVNQGEIWEYAITLGGDTKGDNGEAYLYSTAYGSIYYGTAREVQEAFFTGADGMSQATGTWAYSEISDDHYALVITMSIGDIWNGSKDLGLHWTMLCANDVVEGSIPGNPVPEPGTLTLFAVGTLGLAAAGRRRRS